MRASKISSNSTQNQTDQTVLNVKTCWGKFDDQLLKLFWFCSNGAAFAAIALSGSPVWAAGPPLISSAFKSDALSTLKSKNAPVQGLTVALEKPDHSAALIKPARPLTGTVLEATESIPMPAIAQVDPLSPQPSQQLIEPQPSQPSSELQPAEPTAEPSAEPVPELQPAEPSAAPPAEPVTEPSVELFPPPAPNQGRQFSVEPYFFAPFDVNADVTVLGRQSSLDLSLDDILNLDRAFNAGLRLRSQNDRLGFILDGFYLYAEQSGQLGGSFSSGSLLQFVQQTSPGQVGQFIQQLDPLLLQQAIQIGQQIGLNTPIGVSADGTVSVRQILIDAAVSYRVVDTSLDDSPEANFYPRLTIAPILGIRTNFLRQTIEVDDIRIAGRSIPGNILPPVDREFRFSRTLVEPLIGAQIDLALSEQWSLGLRGDVSGFNIGARQNFTWNLIFGTQYNFSPNFALQLAYRFNSFDFETGEGLRRSELNLRQNGLLLNAVFRF